VSGKIAVWEMWDAKNNRTVKYRTAKVRMLYDCENETFAFMTIISYNADGSVLANVNYNVDNTVIRNIVPDTVGETQFNAVCKNR
jgi:hypothetical protein